MEEADDTRGETRRALVRLGLGSLVGFLILAALAIWWDAPPVEAPDLEPEPRPPLADKENGFLLFDGPEMDDHPLLHEALAPTQAPQDRDSEDPPPWDADLAAEVLSHHASILEAVEAAMARPGFRFPETPVDQPVPHLTRIQSAFRILDLQAWSRFHQGDAIGAVESAGRLTQFARRVTEGDSALIGWLIALTGEAIALETLGQLAGKVEDREALVRILETGTAWARTPEEDAAAFRRTLGFEFRAMREFLDRMGRGALTAEGWPPSQSPGWRSLFAKPNASLVLHAEMLREAAANAARVPAAWSFPVADELLAFPGPPLDHLDLNYFGKTGVAASASVYPKLLEQLVNLRTARSFTLLMAALRLHEIDHGELPAALEGLVPEYLDALPTDPWDGGALRYDRERRLVWSVGEDLRDAGGETFHFSGSEWRQEPTLIVPEREGR